MTGGVLIIGYGNVMRSDDGVGPFVAERLAVDKRLVAATVLRCHQLTPELALDVAQAGLVVLIDAALGPEPGTLCIRSLVDTAGDRAVIGETGAFSHHLEPSTLVALTRELYGATPDVLVVSVGVASLELGETLSPAVEAAMPQVADAVAALVLTRLGAYGDPIASEPARA